jgi:hypothetical protein
MLNFPIRLNDKIAGVYEYAATGDISPSRQVRDVFADLSGKADIQLSKLQQVITGDLPALNQIIYQKQIPVIGAK